MSARDEVLERFRGAAPGQVRHFGEPARVEAALELAAEGVLVCRWVPVSTYEGQGSSTLNMLACMLRPSKPRPVNSGGGVA